MAYASDKEEVAAAAAQWEKAFSEDSPDHILSLYDLEAVLWGTLSPIRRQGPPAIHDYFVSIVKVLPQRKVTFHDPLIRLYWSTAINTGSYTFSWVKDGEAKTLPARYSFTYVNRDGRWMIVDHHSSAMPDPNLLQ